MRNNVRGAPEAEDRFALSPLGLTSDNGYTVIARASRSGDKILTQPMSALNPAVML